MKTLRQYRTEAYSRSLRKLTLLLRNPRHLWGAVRSPRKTFVELSAPFFDVKLRDTPPAVQIALYRNSLLQLCRLAQGERTAMTIEGFRRLPGVCDWVDVQQAEELRERLNHYGSDKASSHDYYLVYQPLLRSLSGSASPQGLRLLEIGLGTNNIDTASNMGLHGRPGASARAFRDFLPGAEICGADVDRRILFSEERIQTFWVDQLSTVSLQELFANQANFDLIIDDGLHTIEANLNTLTSAMTAIRPGGWIVIEDIGPDSECLSVWLAVSSIIGDRFETFLLDTLGGSRMFLARQRRLSPAGIE